MTPPLDQTMPPPDPDPLILVVDDDDSVRRGVARLLRSAGYRTEMFDSAGAFLRRARPDEPTCLILDVQLPDLTGMELQERMARSSSFLPIVFITGHGDIPMSVRAMKAGAVDFLSKPFNDSDLLEAIERALRKSRKYRASIVCRHETFRRLASLTPREREVLDRVVQGMLNKQIADELGTVEKTIKVHRRRVMDKMGVSSVAELVRMIERAAYALSE
jgi:FixJ family two-component response regulator